MKLSRNFAGRYYIFSNSKGQKDLKKSHFFGVTSDFSCKAAGKPVSITS
jgi:hypothetical protein